MAHTKQNKVDLLDHSASHLLHRAGQVASEIFADELGNSGLTPRQYAVLLTVGEHEGLSQTDLVEMTGIDRSTLADIVRRLLRKEMLVRQRTKEDQRAYAVRLSDSGQNALEEFKPKAMAADDRILEAVPSELRDPFLQAMQHLLGEGPEERIPSQDNSGSVNGDDQSIDRKLDGMSVSAA